MYPNWVQEALDKGMVVPDGDTLLMREKGGYPPRTLYIRAYPSRTRWRFGENGLVVLQTNYLTPERCREQGGGDDEYTWVFNPLEVM